MRNKILSLWLAVVILLVVLMVSIGGVTRLTQSGLSMVEWKPVTGILPPTNELSWQKEFKKYQSSPEFKKINFEMDLSGFKKIYFWEYLHRLLGRLIGLVYLLPFLFFLKKDYLRGRNRLKYKLWLGFFLGGLQGLVGWYMVKSGLVNIPHVSHYRLTVHMLLAFLIVVYLVWQIIEINSKKLKDKIKVEINYSKLQKRIPHLALTTVFIQCAYGALTAGLKAGLVYNTWPKMNGSWFPEEIYNWGFSINTFVNTSVGVQWFHRSFAWVVFSLFLVNLVINKKEKSIRLVAAGAFVIVIAQVLVGIVTLVLKVPVAMGVVHQLLAVILLSVVGIQVKLMSIYKN